VDRRERPRRSDQDGEILTPRSLGDGRWHALLDHESRKGARRGRELFALRSWSADWPGSVRLESSPRGRESRERRDCPYRASRTAWSLTPSDVRHFRHSLRTRVAPITVALRYSPGPLQKRPDSKWDFDRVSEVSDAGKGRSDTGRRRVGDGLPPRVSDRLAGPLPRAGLRSLRVVVGPLRGGATPHPKSFRHGAHPRAESAQIAEFDSGHPVGDYCVLCDLCAEAGARFAGC
jgi:hypothetical protein